MSDKFVIAVEDYVPELVEGYSYLALKKQDIIAVIEETEKGGWWYGRNNLTGDEGYFPSTLVDIFEEENKNKRDTMLINDGASLLNALKFLEQKSTQPQHKNTIRSRNMTQSVPIRSEIDLNNIPKTSDENMIAKMNTQQKDKLLLTLIEENKRLTESLKKEKTVREMMEKKLIVLIGEKSQFK
eukprot:TRINITY_DN17152_c0_g1_i1.p1 TRINITY_DN17152_c0_g1~~TRINITY_DN17152_c0_g1_i1.p1  ORF type:complete len:184 (+),score=53.51 TRINITY_DN17152_c0_g1_i1:13-564(+)